VTTSADPGTGPALRLAAAAAAAGFLVLISCSARKASQPAIASVLYCGSYFSACLQTAVAIAPRDRVLILSARHGLLGLDEGPIAPYEQRLDRPGAITATTIRAQAIRRNLAGLPVVALCGAPYAALAALVWAEVETPLAGLGIGDQRHVLACLRTGQYAPGGAGRAA
jgi:hypothetical protein